MAQSRRNFLKAAGVATIGLSLNPSQSFADIYTSTSLMQSKKMKLTFKSYDLQLTHVFTIANSSRKTTPVVLVEVAYEGLIGYGEASLPPYLGESQVSVIEFLKKVNLEQFSSPSNCRKS